MAFSIFFRVKYSKIIFIYILLISSTTFAQKYKPCEVTNESGTSIKGFYKNFNYYSVLGNGFKLYNDDKKKIKISPDYWHTVQLDTLTYHSISNGDGKHRFMKLLEKGPNVSLYIDTIKRTANVPGEGLSMWFDDMYYLLKEGHYYQMPKDRLLNQPDFFFTGAKQLCEEIKKTKKKDIKWREWVQDYNKLTLTVTSE